MLTADYALLTAHKKWAAHKNLIIQNIVLDLLITREPSSLFFKLDKQKQDFDWAGSVRRNERAEKTFYQSAKIIYVG